MNAHASPNVFPALLANTLYGAVNITVDGVFFVGGKRRSRFWLRRITLTTTHQSYFFILLYDVVAPPLLPLEALLLFVVAMPTFGSEEPFIAPDFELPVELPILVS
jgi:hypothetical protein